MGLKKHVQLDNGVQVNYHRITKVEHLVNSETWVFVASYTSQAKRRELDAGGQPYFVEVPHLHAYDDALTVAGAYAWLKGLDEFDGAADVLEEE